jgi:hypothetical protein
MKKQDSSEKTIMTGTGRKSGNSNKGAGNELNYLLKYD